MANRQQTMIERSRNAIRQAVAWAGGMDLIVLLSVLTIVVAIWAFIELADDVLEGDTQAVDERVLLALRNPDDLNDAIGPQWAEDAGRDITALGGVTALMLITGAVVGYLLICKTYHAVWLVLIATVGGLLVSSALKLFFDRPRPSVVPHLAHVSTASFPSGHSMLSAVVYLTLGALLARLLPQRSLRIYVLFVAMSLTFLIGVSRVYLGVHYPTDVLAGWAVGLAWSIMCWLIARALQRRGKVEQEIDTDKAAEQ